MVNFFIHKIKPADIIKCKYMVLGNLYTASIHLYNNGFDQYTPLECHL